MMKKTLMALLCASVVPLGANADSLKSVVQHALTSNPDLLFNRAKSLSSEQAVKQAQGGYFPTVDLKLGYGKENSKTPTTQSIGGQLGDVTLTREESSLEVVQNIFNGFATVGEVNRNKHLWHAQKFKTLGVADDLSLDVTEKYLDVLKQQQLLRLARINLKEHRRVFSMIEQRSSAGVSRQAELEQAKGRLALANSNYISVTNDLRDGRVSYMKIVGKPASHLVWPRVPSGSSLPKNVFTAIQHGLDSHPTLKSAHADIQEAKSQHRVAQANDYPKLDAVLSASRNRNLDGLRGLNNDNLAMLRLSYNLFRGGSDLARKRETAYQVQEAYEIKNNSVLQVEESVRLSWNAWLTAGHRLRYLKEHVDASSKTRQAYTEQFKVGKRTLLDLLDSQNEYYQAQIDYENGHFDEVFSRFRILNSMGTLLSFFKGKLPVGVHNNDVATSHHRIHHAWLDKPLTSVPDVDLTRKAKKSPDLHKKRHTKENLAKTTLKHKKVTTQPWYVFVKPDGGKSSSGVYSRLKRLGMKVLMLQKDDQSWVALGPYEYRSQAGLAMTKLHQRAKLHGSVAHYYPKKKHS